MRESRYDDDIVDYGWQFLLVYSCGYFSICYKIIWRLSLMLRWEETYRIHRTPLHCWYCISYPTQFWHFQGTFCRHFTYFGRLTCSPNITPIFYNGCIIFLEHTPPPHHHPPTHTHPHTHTHTTTTTQPKDLLPIIELSISALLTQHITANATCTRLYCRDICNGWLCEFFYREMKERIQISDQISLPWLLYY